ncbi:hypothetical protein IHE55_05365 [Streptomyces pactum]|uniref:DUF3592 domain-containing protein n=1 Tax=Streptomyces pactum TaxID=68249 RepID=A0ABS0NGI8_9ACTN|nr:hypothetical protein [Streptomyces pactum]MBH5334262.1 hypothetical protein [Streptomyces pactum]
MEERPSDRPPPDKTFLEKAAIVVAPGSVIFAMLYYLGRTRVNAYYSVFGISVTELGLSTEEFLLASPNATFFPLWILLLAGLVGLMGFALLDRRLARTQGSRTRRRIYRAAAVAGAVLLLFSFIAVYVRPGWYVAPLLGALGAAAALFGLALRRSGSRAAAAGPAPGGGRERLRTLVGAVLVAMLTLCVFSGVAWYVHREGRAVALRELREGLDDRPSVRVYADKPVFGIPERLLEKYQPYRYVYDRFAVLTTSSTRYYLVPRTPPVGRLVTIRRDDPTMRVEVEQAVMRRGR